jgi:hypothetical protein
MKRVVHPLLLGDQRLGFDFGYELLIGLDRHGCEDEFGRG